MSIIHGASIYTLVYRTLESLLYKSSELKHPEHFYVNHWQLICGFFVVLGILFWVATEYYWFMILVRRRPSPLDTVAQYMIGACQIASAFVVSTPRYLIWMVAVTGIVGLGGYVNSWVNVQRANIPNSLRAMAKANLYRGCSILIITILIMGFLWLRFALPRSNVVFPTMREMDLALGIMLATIIAAATIVGIFASAIVHKAENTYLVETQTDT